MLDKTFQPQEIEKMAKKVNISIAKLTQALKQLEAA